MPASDGRRLLARLGRYKSRLAISLASAILASGFLGGAVGLLPDLMGALANASDGAALVAEPGETTGPFAGLRAQIDALWQPVRGWLLERGYARLPLFMVVLYLFKGLFSYVAVYGMRRVGLQTVADLRELLYAKTLAQDDVFFRRFPTPDVFSRITLDLVRVQNLFASDVSHALQSVPIIVVMLVLSFVNAWQISLACLLMLPVFIWTASRFGGRVKRASQRGQERAAQLAGVIEETLVARRVVQAFSALDYEVKRFSQTLQRMLREDFRVARATAAAPPVMECLGALFGAGVMVFAGWLIRQGQLTGAQMFAAMIALFISFAHVRKLVNLNNNVQQAMAAARRIFEVLDAPQEIRSKPGASALPRFSDRIELDDVQFSYGRGPVLDGVSLQIDAGETHALVGPSGSGKTTLAMLLPRFFDPSQGAIRIDGHDLRDVELESLRGQIALVSQETHLFDDSVLANIAYGRTDVDEEQVRAAARAAHADGFIRELPDGYSTRLGDRGGRLSTGQRQRISIARAFLKNAPILILDEATSALDSESERKVQQALGALLQGRTALIIAHRLSTVAMADQIHVLDKGRRVENGTHAQLMARGGLYAHLHALQAAGESQG